MTSRARKILSLASLWLLCAPVARAEGESEKEHHHKKDSSQLKALREEAGALEVKVKASPTDGEAWAKLGEVDEELGRYREAIESFTQALKLHPDDLKLRRALAKNELDEGEELMHHERPSSARKRFHQALADARKAEDKKLEEEAEDKAREAGYRLRPSLFDSSDVGLADVNHYFYTRNMLYIPLPDSELSLLAGENSYLAKDPTGVGSLNYFRGGFRYNLNENWSVEALGGGYGTYELALHTEADCFQAYGRLIRDIEYETPLSLNSRYKYTAEQFFYNWTPISWLQTSGDWSHEGYDDSSNQIRYNLGLAFLPINHPEHEALSLAYSHSGDSNDLNIDPLLRFAPLNLQIDSIGIRWDQHLCKNFAYHASYFRSFANDGGRSDNFLLGIDAELGEGSKLGLDVSHGPFPNGRIPEAGFGIFPNNYNVALEGKLAF